MEDDFNAKLFYQIWGFVPLLQNYEKYPYLMTLAFFCKFDWPDKF